MGKPGKTLILFTIPLFISVIFQQMYNMADSIIAGKFAGTDALAAVGASYPITMLFMAVAIGSQIGTSVVISNYFGAKNYSMLKTTISTTAIAGFVLSLILTIFGVLCSPLFIKFLNTPDNIFNDSNLYLQIYTGGFIFLFLYNITTGIFNSLGDSKTPLYLLIASSVSNIILDYIFVRYCHLAVAGVAYATFICQGIACIVSLILLAIRFRKIKEPNYQKFSKKALAEVCKLAIPSILQQSFISIGNLFIQLMVNNYSSDVIAGYSAAIKINTFAVTTFTTLGNGVSNFTAQNLGSLKIKRIKKGFISGLGFSLLIAVIFSLIFTLFSKELVNVFMEDDNSVDTDLALSTGKEFLMVVAPFYISVATKLICYGILRGSNNMLYFMIATFTDLILRVILAFVFMQFFGTLGIWMGWPISWIIATIMSFIFYKSNIWLKKYRDLEFSDEI
ncbi:TPA: MATE family efflux transporter [Candidatus Avacholeplasma faecigallinarum]|nr:MATE family efflux transporter [Candidatus Avacholeplasma faecigallinarum]